MSMHQQPINSADGLDGQFVKNCNGQWKYAVPLLRGRCTDLVRHVARVKVTSLDLRLGGLP